MAAKLISPAITEKYFELVKAFPLVHLRDDAHLAEALAVIDGLLEQDLDSGGDAYLEVLTGLVEDYEDENVPIEDAPPQAVLRELMRQHGLTQAQLSKGVGIAQSTISSVLTGERKLTLRHVSKLAKFFHVKPEAFLAA